jgi:hypothetical protein
MVTAWAAGASVGPVAAGAIADVRGDRFAYLAGAVVFLALTATAVRRSRQR